MKSNTYAFKKNYCPELGGFPSRDIFAGLPQSLKDEDEKSLPVESLVMHNMREAILYAGRCARGRIEPGDLFSLCYTALGKAAPRFRPGGIRFFAYAKQDIRGEIARYWKSLDVVKNSSEHESETHPQVIRKNFTSGAEEGEEEGHELDVEAIEPQFSEPEFEAINVRERWSIVAPLLHKYLNERERMVLSLVYESGFNFEQIRNLVVPTVSRSAIQNTHGRALRKIRNALFREKKLYTV
jgi:RNA polymerase sigma factor (sigma-70 family)